MTAKFEVHPNGSELRVLIDGQDIARYVEALKIGYYIDNGGLKTAVHLDMIFNIDDIDITAENVIISIDPHHRQVMEALGWRTPDE